MKAQRVLSVFLILTSSLSGFQDTFILAFFGNIYMNELTVIGRLDEDVILPSSFESGSEVIIHWKYQDRYSVHSYFKGSDHLGNQDPRYANRTSLFYNEIQNGNASLLFRRLSLLDEGIYTCYVGTKIQSITNKVVLKVGVFLTPVMKYEKKNTNSFLICSVLSVYPRPVITWKMDNTPIPENNMEETGSLGSFSINSILDVTGSHSSYECTIKNSLLSQTWTGRWTMKDGLHKTQSENVSLSCQLVNDYFSPNQDFKVTWSRVENGTFSVLACYLSSSQNTTINEPRFSWNKELINQGDFSMNLMHLHLSDSGEYLCDISSDEYTLLTIHTVHVESSQETASCDKGLQILVYCLILAVPVALLISAAIWIYRVKHCRERDPVCADGRATNASGNENESMPLSECPASTGNETGQDRDNS
ncbi:HERV-H LTR-associating protein 2 [Sapajus apella]|uniref:HERV-H LTR-associating protein 2 n=1 Tax=Sapajus apella TaxID=9515 RepID=A0A6J3JKH9_SAPAP|nr:HERV-H LTR-associating protein 2 [Sapajus apella]XP_032155066.1 HERV-H LTR-associating protein 2 [Sapajus apella]